MTLPTLEERIQSILRDAAAFRRPCRFCQAPLWFIRREATGKFVPYTEAGVNHFIDCPNYEQWRGQIRAKRDTSLKSEPST